MNKADLQSMSWRERIAWAKSDNDDYPELYDWLDTQACDWDTCACSELDSKILRDHTDKPFDHQLQILGYELYSKVSSHKWNQALRILDRLEKRGRELILQLHDD